MLSANEIITLIKKEASLLSTDNDSVAAIRHAALLRVLSVLGESGFPSDPNQQMENSLVPYVFQEANYDDIDWTHRLAPLQQLNGLFLIDIMVQMGGRERHELNDEDYEAYVKLSFAAIDHQE
jgi:hypothetical protein